MSDTFELICPTTGERMTAFLEGTTFGTAMDVDALLPETQIWWSEVVREYALLRERNPLSTPRALVEDVVQNWARDQRTPER
jgi:hypothetical protein